MIRILLAIALCAALSGCAALRHLLRGHELRRAQLRKSTMRPILPPVIILAALSLSGCANISAQQAAIATQAFCVLSADGAVLAVATTKGGAQATAQKVSAAQPVACDAATKLGAIIAAKP